MSETTNLKLKKHDEPLNENTNQFNVKDYLNGNWDKIEDFAGQVNDKVIEIEDSIDLVKQRTEQAVEDINTDIANIKQEQTEQNTNIQKNTTDISNLDTNKASKTELQEATIALQAELLKAQEEIERQNKDYEAGTLEGQGTGESLYLQDSSDARFREFGIGGNSKQEKRSGKNKADLSKVSQKTFNGITCTYNKEDNSVTLNGTCTTDNTGFAIESNGLAIQKLVKDKTTLTVYYISGECSGAGTVNVQVHATGYVSNIPIVDLRNLKDLKIRTATYGSTNYPDIELLKLNIRVNEGAVLDNFTFKLMLTEDVDTEYEDFGAMPSLEFPSETQAVGQDVNMLDIEELVDGYIDDQGRFVTAHTMGEKRTDFIKVKPKATLTFKIIETEDKNTDWIGIGEYSNANISSFIKRNVAREKNIITLTTSETTEYVIVSARNLQNATKVVLKEGNGDVKWSPYGCGSANVTVCNKDRLDFNKWNNITASHGTVEQVENGIKLTATANDCYTNTFAYKFQGTLNRDKIECYGFIAKPNTKYTFSCKVNNIAISKRISMFFSDKDYNIISYVTSATSVLTATTPENCKYITIRVGVTNTGDSLTFTDLQVEEGDAADYTAHEEQTFTMPIQAEMLEGDYLDLDSEEEVHTWGKYVFTGDETISKSGITNNNSFWMNSNFLPNLLNAEILNYTATDNITPNILCTHLKTLKPVLIVSYDNEGITICANDNNLTDITIRLGFGKSSEINTADKCKAWLKQQYDAGTPVTVYYKLAEPKRIPFTDSQKAVAKEIRQTLHSYKDGTHVYSTDTVSPIFNVKYTIDQKAYIDAQLKPIIQELTGGN